MKGVPRILFSALYNPAPTGYPPLAEKHRVEKSLSPPALWNAEFRFFILL